MTGKRGIKIITTVLWSLMAICVAMIVLPEIPCVQSFCGERVEKMLSEKLGTEVKIGKIAVELPNRAVANDLTVFDQHGDTLLVADKISAKISLIPLIKDGKIIIYSAQLFTPEIRLTEDEGGKNNFQFVLDSLKSKDSSGAPLDMQIQAFVLRDGTVSMTTAKERLKAENVNGYFALDHLTDESMKAKIYELSFDGRRTVFCGAAECTSGGKSGSKIGGKTNNKHVFFISDTDSLSDASAGFCDNKISVKSLRAIIIRHGEQMTAKDMKMQLSKSEINIRKATYDTGRKTFSAEIQPSRINISDISDLTGTKTGWKQNINISATASGNDKAIKIPHINIHSDDGSMSLRGTEIAASFDGKMARGNIEEARLGNNILKMLQIPVLKKLGFIAYSGTLEKNCDRANVVGTVKTDVGNITVNGTMTDEDFDVTMNSDCMNLRYISGVDRLGFAAGKVNANGNLKTKHVNATAQISSLEFDGHIYKNIGFIGEYRDNKAEGTINIADPKCDLNLTGTADIAGRKLTLNGDVNNFSYNGMNFDGHIEADVTAGSNNDLAGSISVTNDDIRAEINGNFSYTALYDDIIYAIKSRIPSVPLAAVPKNVGNHKYTFALDITDTETLKNALTLPVSLDEGLSISGNVDNRARILNVEGSVPRVVYDGREFRNCTFSITTPDDRLQVAINGKNVQADGETYDVNVTASAEDDILSTKMGWKSPKNGDFNGILDVETAFSYDSSGNTAIRTQIKPSQVIFHDSIFSISSGTVEYAKRRLKVENVGVSHGQQHIMLNGTASDSSRDSIVADLRDVNVEYLMNAVDFHDVEFCGLASGQATIASVFGSPTVSARLKVRKFQFEYGDLGVLDVTAQWNETGKQIDIDGLCDDGTGRLKIDGFVSPSRYAIDLKMRLYKTAMGYLNTFTSGVLNDINGRADGHLNVIGPLNKIQLIGAVKANADFSVPVLNTTYRLGDEDSVYFVPDDIQFRNTKIYDSFGNQAVMNGGVHHKTLGQFTFDLDINTQKLLCFDKKEFGDDSFFGTIYASGETKIHNIRGETDIDGNLTPLAGSSFVYNASRENYINTQKFITYRDADSINTVEKQSITPVTAPVRKMSSDLYADFTLNANQNLRLSLLTDSKTNDYIDLYGDGMLKTTYYNKDKLNIFGAYTVDHGNYTMTIRDLMKKKFQFRQGGTVMFVGNPYEATVNMQAVYTVTNASLSDLNIGNSFANNNVKVDCIMNITGISGDPKVSFDLDLPNVNSDEKQMIRSLINSEEDMNQQVVYLLGIGRFYTKDTNNEEQSQTSRSQTQLAMQSLLSGTITSQVNNILTNVIHNNDWNIGANIATGDEGWMNAMYEGTVSGRMFNNRLLMNGQFGYRDNIKTANPSFVGDFEIQYLLTPNGSLSVKAYNQSNDRYFTKSSFQTQGISFVIKKDFQKFRDLFRKKKKKGDKSRK